VRKSSSSSTRVYVEPPSRIGDTPVIAKRTPINQQVERSLVPTALNPATLDLVKPQVLHPRLDELWLNRCQTSLNFLIYGANFGNYVRVTDVTDPP